jgi:hypothetical protein
MGTLSVQIKHDWKIRGRYFYGLSTPCRVGLETKMFIYISREFREKVPQFVILDALLPLL